jgi:hypothetical protein
LVHFYEGIDVPLWGYEEQYIIYSIGKSSIKRYNYRAHSTIPKAQSQGKEHS